MSYPPPDPNRNLDPLRNQPIPGQRVVHYPPASRPQQPQADRCPICNNVVAAGAVRLPDGVYHSHCALAHVNHQISDLAGRLDQITQAQSSAHVPAAPMAEMDLFGNVQAAVDELQQRVDAVEANQGGKVGRGDLKELKTQISAIQNTHNTSSEIVSKRLNDIETQLEAARARIAALPQPGGDDGLEEDDDLEDDIDPEERWNNMSAGARLNLGREAGYKKNYSQVLAQKAWADQGKSAQAKLKKALAAKD